MFSMLTSLDLIIVIFLQEQFHKKYKKDIERFGMLKRYEDSQKFLTENAHLACEETANYLVLWCVNLEVEEVRHVIIT